MSKFLNSLEKKENCIQDRVNSIYARCNNTIKINEKIQNKII